MEKVKVFFRKLFDGVTSAQITICVICFLVTLLFTVQVRTINVSESDILKLKREDELRNEINQWKEVYEISSQKIIELNQKIEEYRVASSKTDDTVAVIKKELDTANLLAGLTDVKGEGIKITLDDSKVISEIHKNAGYIDNNVFIIHDTDLMTIINELSIAGAEALSINGQRIISTSSIRCVGPIIQVNGVRISTPFTISAIGDPAVLSGSLKLRGGIIDDLKQADIEVSIEQADEVFIPAYDQALKFEYTKTVGKER